jgi:hypothetical protein
MKRHWNYDQWGPAQKIPVAICGIMGAVPVLTYFFGYMTDARLPIVGAALCALVAARQMCGHLATRINYLEDRLNDMQPKVDDPTDNAN